MRRTEAQLPPPTIEVNPAYSNIRACTRSIFCDGASSAATAEIGHRSKASEQTVTKQALPTTKPAGIQVLNLGNYNLEGTGQAYQELVQEGTLDVAANGHADTTLRPF